MSRLICWLTSRLAADHHATAVLTDWTSTVGFGLGVSLPEGWVENPDIRVDPASIAAVRLLRALCRAYTFWSDSGRTRMRRAAGLPLPRRPRPVCVDLGARL